MCEVNDMGIKIEVEVPDHMVHIISEMIDEVEPKSIHGVMSMALETLNWVYEKEQNGMNVVAVSPSRDTYSVLDRSKFTKDA